MTENIAKPIDQNERLAIVDILRGWALIGVILVNYFLFFYLTPYTHIPKKEYASHILKLLTDIFLQTKAG